MIGHVGLRFVGVATIKSGCGLQGKRGASGTMRRAVRFYGQQRRNSMSEEHITTTTSPDGNTSHTTVSSGSSGAGWLFGLIAIVLLGFGIYYFALQSNTSSKKDNAIAAAAADVGNAAKDVGNAAQDAASSVKKP
jgi:uncharacterized protein HemX